MYIKYYYIINKIKIKEDRIGFSETEASTGESIGRCL